MDKLIILYYYSLHKLYQKINNSRFHSIIKSKKKYLFFKWIKNNSAYFSQFNNIEDFPIINKKMMMDNFNSMNTRKLDLNKCLVLAISSENSRDFTPMINNISIGLSSGTSGNRGLFCASQMERNIWAGKIMAKILPRSIFQVHKIALFLRANNNLYTNVGSKNIQFSFYDLLNKIDNHIKQLNHNPPNILLAPPSMLRILSLAKIEGRLHIQPEKIYSIAEVLDPIDENHIKNAWNQKVHQIYQCTEGFLASTCEEGNIHINEDSIIIEKEYISKHKFIPIITDLDRKVQPIIRYRLNDILEEDAESCPCGSSFTRIKNILGREDDLFYFKNKKDGQYIPVFPDFIRRTIIKSSDQLEEYHIQQISYTKLKISTRSNQNIEKIIATAFESFFHQQNLEMPELVFHDYQIIYGNNKMKRIERSFMHKSEGASVG